MCSITMNWRWRRKIRCFKRHTIFMLGIMLHLSFMVTLCHCFTVSRNTFQSATTFPTTTTIKRHSRSNSNNKNNNNNNSILGYNDNFGLGNTHTFESNRRKSNIIVLFMGKGDGKKKRKKASKTNSGSGISSSSSNDNSITPAPLRVTNDSLIPVRRQIRWAQMKKEAIRNSGTSFRQTNVKRTKYRKSLGELEDIESHLSSRETT